MSVFSALYGMADEQERDGMTVSGSQTAVEAFYKSLGLVLERERRLVYGVTSNDVMVYVQYIQAENLKLGKQSPTFSCLGPGWSSVLYDSVI